MDANPESTGILFQMLEIWRNSAPLKNGIMVDPITFDLMVSKSLPDWMPTIREQIFAYHESLKSASALDASIAALQFKKITATPLVIGFPAALIGWVLNAFPLLLARKVADQKVKRVDFYSWILVTSAAFLYVFWYALIAVLAFIILPAWKAIALLFIIVSTGQYCWNYYAYYLNWKTQQDGLRLATTLRDSLTEQQQLVLKSIISLS